MVDAAHLRRRLNPGSDKPDTDTLLEIWAEFDGICPYCGREIVDGHIDHIIPISKGGTNDRENLVYVCAECNLRKHDRSLEEFFAYMDKVEIEYDNSRLLEKFPEIQT